MRQGRYSTALCRAQSAQRPEESNAAKKELGTMRLEIDQNDFQRLSPNVQRELIETLAGKAVLAKGAVRAARASKLRWRSPINLTREQATRLVHGLSDDYRRRLQLFARKSGRVRMKEILALTGETDLRATSAFQREITRRLRRIVDDPERKAQLIAWDFEATKWDDKGITITDGVYYVTEKTAVAIKKCLKAGSL